MQALIAIAACVGVLFIIGGVAVLIDEATASGFVAIALGGLLLLPLQKWGDDFDWRQKS